MEIAPIRVMGLDWVRGPAKIEDGEIVLDQGRAEKYEFLNPEASEKMAFELAVLPWHKRDEREIVSFVRRYGLLSHGAEDVKRGEYRESLEDWWREATSLHFIGAFYQTLMDSKKSGSTKKIRDFLQPYGLEFRGRIPVDVDFDEACLVEASIMLSNFINAGMNGRRNEERCVWGLNAIGPGAFRLTQHPPDLISRAYAAFATLIANNAETRFCVVCGKQYRPKPRQGETCGEACASTNRGRKRRARQKQASEETS